MKITTQKELWNLWHKLDAELPEDTDMSVIAEQMKSLASQLGDEIPEEIEEEFFESINSVADFKSFEVFSKSVYMVYKNA